MGSIIINFFGWCKDFLGFDQIPIIITVSVAFLALICFSLKGCKKSISLSTCNNYFCKDDTNWLKGIAIIFIIYSHYFGMVNDIYAYIILGTIGVAFFFLLSGFGLMSSKMVKKDYNKSFLKNKLLRLYSPFFVAFIICCIVFLIFQIKFENNIFTEFCVLSLPNTINWYLKVQAGMYIVFWLFSLIYKNNHNKLFIASIIVISVLYMIIGYLSDIASYWYQNTLFFPLGMLLAMYKDRVYYLLNNNFIKAFVISAVLFLLGFSSEYLSIYLIGEKHIFVMLYIVAFIIIAIVLMTKISGSSKVLQFFGKYSIELYLSHSILMNIFVFVDSSNVLFFLLFMALSVLMALFIKYVSQLIIKGIDKIKLPCKKQ